MKSTIKIIALLFCLLPFLSAGQDNIRFASGRPTDSALTNSSLHVVGNALRVDALADPDTNTVIGVAPNGVFVKRRKTNASTIDTTSLSNRINQRVKYTDTAAMLAPYATKVALFDTANTLRTLINAGGANTVKYADTAGMLLPYATKSKVVSDSTFLRGLINSKIDSIRRLPGSLIAQAKINGSWVNMPFTDSAGGTPAGSTGQIQYNNSGAFAASPNFTWDSTHSTLRIGGGTKTSSLSIISSSTFVDGDVYIESSTSTGPSVTLNATNGSGKKYTMINRPTGQFTFYEAGSALDALSINPTDYQTLVGRSSNGAGAGLGLYPTAAGGVNWLILSTVTGNTLGGGKLAFFNGGSYALSLGSNAFKSTFGVNVHGVFGVDNGGGEGLGILSTTGIVDLQSYGMALALNMRGNGIIIGGSGVAPNASSALEIKSTTKGFLPPRLTTSQRSAMSVGANEDGMIIICTDCLATDGSTGVLQMYQHSTASWKNAF